MITAQNGGEHRVAMMRLLLDAGADANKQNEYGTTALMIAAQSTRTRYGCAGMMRLLVDAKADVNKQDEDGWTALMFVTQNGGEHGVAMMRLLLDAKADVDKQNEFGWTALMHIAVRGGEHRVAMMRLLLDAGADVDKQDEDGATALMQTARFGSKHGLVYIAPMMRLLVASGARIPLVSKLHADTPPELAGYINGAQNWTPLHRAADARNADAIIKCMSEGMRPDAVVDSPHTDMLTALSIAESTTYPTAQPVCERCLELLRPSLVKGGTPSSGSLFNGDGNGGGGGGDIQK
jgi:hypothetical protein